MRSTRAAMFEAESPFQSISQGGTDVSPEAAESTANGWAAAAGEEGLNDSSAAYANTYTYGKHQSTGRIDTADLAIDLPTTTALSAESQQQQLLLDSLRSQQQQYQTWFVDYLASSAAQLQGQITPALGGGGGGGDGDDVATLLVEIYTSAAGRSYLHCLKVHGGKHAWGWWMPEGAWGEACMHGGNALGCCLGVGHTSVA